MACIFHHPFIVEPGGRSGSAVRSYQLLQAFKRVMEVEVVTGYARERQHTIRKVKRDVAKGRDFDFVYSESSTLPTLLTEAHHVPTYPNLDFGFLAHLKRKGIPTGLFYRDIYWRFEKYVHIPLRQRVVSYPFYWYDWWQYQRLVDVLFLPSLEMAQHLPSSWPSEKLAALPPGVPLHPKSQTKVRAKARLNLFYVGGVTPPIYDLTPSFDMLRATPQAQLVLCCREQEWQAWQHHYDVPGNVTIVHVSGDALKEYYAEADVFIILRHSNPYLEFAMPIKLFEALGYNLPIITTRGNSGGNFVEANGLGWIVETVNEFEQLIRRLVDRPVLLEEKRRHLDLEVQKHTWQARAKQVAETLESYKR